MSQSAQSITRPESPLDSKYGGGATAPSPSAVDVETDVKKQYLSQNRAVSAIGVTFINGRPQELKRSPDTIRSIAEVPLFEDLAHLPTQSTIRSYLSSDEEHYVSPLGVRHAQYRDMLRRDTQTQVRRASRLVDAALDFEKLTSSNTEFGDTKAEQKVVEGVDNLNDLLESQKILTRLQSCGDYLSKRLPTNSKRSSSSARKSILTQATKRKLQNDMIEGTKLKDVVQIFPKDIKHPEAINYWREFEHIKFWKSPTVSRVIRQILQTQIPEIGVSYQVIIDEFLHQDWPINIFLHGGLMRDIMTSTIGNDVDIAFTCPHTEMKKICDGKNWKCSIRKDIPYWVIGGESNFETKLEGFPLSFNGLSRFHIADFACNTIYYDCKNQILIDRYGRGVDSALAKKLTLPIFTWDDRVKWRDTDFLPGVKMYRFFKFVTRGFDYDIEAAKFIQESLVDYVENDPEGAQQSCFHALRKLARGQDSQQDAHKYKKKLKKSVKELFVNLVDDETKSSAAIKREADAYWNESWETIVNKVINQGVFTKGLDLKNANEQWNSEIDIGDGYEESDYDENFGTRVVSGDEVGDTPCSEEQTKKGLGDHVQTIVKLSCSLESIEFHQASPQLLAELIE